MMNSPFSRTKSQPRADEDEDNDSIIQRVEQEIAAARNSIHKRQQQQEQSAKSQSLLLIEEEGASTSWEEIQDVPGPGLTQAPQRNMWGTRTTPDATPASTATTTATASSPASKTGAIASLSKTTDLKKEKKLVDEDDDLWAGLEEEEPLSGTQQPRVQVAVTSPSTTRNSPSLVTRKNAVTSIPQSPASPKPISSDPSAASPTWNVVSSNSPLSKERRQRMAAAIRMQRNSNRNNRTNSSEDLDEGGTDEARTASVNSKQNSLSPLSSPPKQRTSFWSSPQPVTSLLRSPQQKASDTFFAATTTTTTASPRQSPSPSGLYSPTKSPTNDNSVRNPTSPTEAWTGPNSEKRGRNLSNRRSAIVSPHRITQDRMSPRHASSPPPPFPALSPTRREVEELTMPRSPLGRAPQPLSSSSNLQQQQQQQQYPISPVAFCHTREYEDDEDINPSNSAALRSPKSTPEVNSRKSAQASNAITSPSKARGSSQLSLAAENEPTNPEFVEEATNMSPKPRQSDAESTSKFEGGVDAPMEGSTNLANVAIDSSQVSQSSAVLFQKMAGDTDSVHSPERSMHEANTQINDDGHSRIESPSRSTQEKNYNVESGNDAESPTRFSQRTQRENNVPVESSTGAQTPTRTKQQKEATQVPHVQQISSPPPPPPLSPEHKITSPVSPKMLSPTTTRKNENQSGRSSAALSPRHLKTISPPVSPRQKSKPSTPRNLAPLSPGTSTATPTKASPLGHYSQTISNDSSIEADGGDRAQKQDNLRSALNRPRNSPGRKSKSSKHGSPQPVTPNRKGKIRFRDPFPVLKPPVPARSPTDIVGEHATGKPQDTVRWLKPQSDLRQLIVAAMGSSLQRRSNACGALKVLLTGSKKNQVAMVRTDSCLASLVFAASQPIPASLDREMALDARTRAVACISAVCEPKENRTLVLMYPGMLDCLAQVIGEDNSEARVLACGACALIAKTVECREALVDEKHVIDLLAQVLGGEQKENATANEMAKTQNSVARLIEEKKEDMDEEDQSGFHSSLGRSLSAETENKSAFGTGHETDEDDDSAYNDTDNNRSNRNGRSFEDDHDSVNSHSGASGSDLDASTDEEGDQGDDDTDPGDDNVSRRSSKKEQSGSQMRKKKVEVSSMRQISKEKNKEFFERTRSNSCAVFLHLSKHCAVSSQLCSNDVVLHNTLLVAQEHVNPIHTKCLEVLFNFSRFPYNNSILTDFPGTIQCLLNAGDSQTAEDRVLALRVFQNLSTDASSKLKLATEQILTFITACAMRSELDEKEAAVSTLYNLTTEPGAVVAITNTKNAVATLVHLAHNPSSTTDVRLRSSAALCTISLWLQTLAGTGKVPSGESALLPTQRTTGWERWD